MWIIGELTVSAQFGESIVDKYGVYYVVIQWIKPEVR